MKEHELSEHEQAFQLGKEAGNEERTVSTNPYDPAAQPDGYEGWLDGWGEATGYRPGKAHEH